MPRRKKTIRSKRKTGLSAIPLDNFEKCRYYFYEEIESKDKTKIIKDYLKTHKLGKKILSLPDDHLRASDVAATIFWSNSNLEQSEDFEHAMTYLNDVYIPGKIKHLEWLEENKQEDDVKVTNMLTPAERLANKIDNLVLEPLDYYIDSWSTENVIEFDLYNTCISNGVKGNSTKMIASHIKNYLTEYSSALNKEDPDIVECYSHIPTKEKKKRIKIFEDMLKDLERIKHTTLMQRRAKKQTVRSADKQISKIQYKLRDVDFKLESINPILIVGSHRLYTFNTKTRNLTILVSTDVGFEISGSTIKNLNPVKSVKVKLRKPDDILQLVLGRSDKTIDEEINKLTTKSKPANGRINTDTILLRTT